MESRREKRGSITLPQYTGARLEKQEKRRWFFLMCRLEFEGKRECVHSVLAVRQGSGKVYIFKCLARPTRSVAFRSAKGCPFAERKATLLRRSEARSVSYGSSVEEQPCLLDRFWPHVLSWVATPF